MLHLVLNASLILFVSALTVFKLFWELLLVVKTEGLEILKIVPITNFSESGISIVLRD